MLADLTEGFFTVLAFVPLLTIFAGSLLGVIGGATPGISSAASVALALPFTYGMDPTLAIILLVAIYSGATYGGSITATLLNTPGTPEAAIMTFDGYSMTRKGQAGKALWAALISGTIGGLLGAVILVVASVPLAEEALRFGPPEYAALAILGLTALSMLTEGSVLKASISALIGVMVAFIGLDPIIGTPRLTFGFPVLLDGIPLIASLIGLFAVSEALVLLTSRETIQQATSPSFWSNMLTWAELKRQFKFMLLGTGLGIFIGVKPGGGSTIASIISYSVAKQVSSQRENFGKGQMEGLSTPEAADKATVGAALIPTLTLGLPASASTAVLIGALTLQGIQPGPNLFAEQGPLVYAVFASLFVANLAVFLIGLVGVQLITKVTTVSRPALGIIVLALTLVGSFASETTMKGMWIAFLFGLIGYMMKLYGFPVGPIILSLVLTPILEINVRRSLILSNGELSIFVERPITLVLLILSVIVFILPIYFSIRSRRRGPQQESGV